MPRLTTELTVLAALRIASQWGIFASILRKGDMQAGTIFLEIEKTARESQLLIRQFNMAGLYEWVVISPPASNNTTPASNNNMDGGWCTPSEIAKRLDREVAIDPDCWIISTQDKHGRNIFTLGD